jgi:4-amino-4-deoxy-L-arabinose transferase-like glycosyltransferase
LWLPVVAGAIYLLYFHGLGNVGLIGPDEPRYASVGREMFFSGDWVTPRLWGEAWFEKPPLEYWGIASAYSLGFDDNLAPRVFNALLAAAFLPLFWIVLRREFSAKVAWIATAILATSAGWIAESRIAVMDLPLTAMFAAAMLCGLTGWYLAGAVFLALAVLAKGLVPLVLALPALWMLRYRWRKLALPAIVFLAIVQPWHIAMTARHGWAFFDEFILKHHFSRFADSSLQHVQPLWFFLPVALALIFPWTPLVALLRWPVTDRQRFLFMWFAWTMIFFSISRNKLPGYILPAIPPLAALMGIALAEARRPLVWAAGCGALLGLASLASDLLPSALAGGLRSAEWNIRPLPLILMTATGIVAGLWQGWRGVALTMVLIAGLMVHRLSPTLDYQVSARGIWRETIEPRRDDVCAEELHRAWRYGLNFYAIEPLPECSTEPKPLRIRQRGSEPPEILLGPRTEFRAPAASPGRGAF